MFILLWFRIRYLARTVTTLRSFPELQSQAGFRRIVLVRNLPQGYDISHIISTIRANPIEAIIPGDDQLTVRFLSEQLARKCVNSGGGAGLGWSLTLNEETSPTLSAYTVAATGYSRLSRWITLRNLSHDLREEDLRTHLIPKEVVYSRLDPIEHQAQIGFLDLRQALRARPEIFKPILVSRLVPPGGRQPEERGAAVRISNVTSLDMDHTIRSCVREFEESAAHHALFYSLYPKKNLIQFVFATSISAREFIEKYMSMAERIDAQLLLKPQRGPLPLSKIIAADLGTPP
ncbi:hypothetical protein EDD85DRAFT_951655 [Armillaria nabsnona]|nr:hypothetical protein EDD85DRAFT_951655 [Armillaria nabsnona]